MTVLSGGFLALAKSDEKEKVSKGKSNSGSIDNTKVLSYIYIAENCWNIKVDQSDFSVRCRYPFKDENRGEMCKICIIVVAQKTWQRICIICHFSG